MDTKDKKAQDSVKVVAEPKPSRQFNYGNLFWGLLLIFVGSIFLLDNFNVIDAEFSNIWRLWPLFIVAAGVSILSIKGWVGSILSTTLVALMLSLIAVVSLGVVEPNSNTATSTKNIEISRINEEVKNVNLVINGGAGTIDIRSVESTAIATARLESNFTNLRQDSSLQEGTQNVTLTLDHGERWWHGNYKNNLLVTLTESLPVDMKVDAGASKISGDLSNVQLRSLDIDSGASEVEFKLGNKFDTTDVSVDMGMSSITFLVPKDSGVSVRLDSGMSNKSIPGLREISSGYFETENYASAAKKINLRGNIGMTNLKLNYY